MSGDFKSFNDLPAGNTGFGGKIPVWQAGTKALQFAAFFASLFNSASAAVFRTNIGAMASSYLDTDTALAANSDVKIASQKAVKAYIDALLGAQDAMVYKGVIDCSANPNYPAADKGHTYRISVAGKIGGGSGSSVEVGDIIICLNDATASGNQATVGTSWNIIQANIDGAVVGPASATADAIALFNGTTGKIIKDSAKAVPSGTIVGTSDSQTLTNKVVTSVQIARQATYTPGQTTLDASLASAFNISNSGAVTIGTISNGSEGQLLYLHFNDSNTTLDRASCYLAGGVNFVSSEKNILVLQKWGSIWHEVSRQTTAA